VSEAFFFPDKVHDLRQWVTESDWPNWWTVNKHLFFAKYARENVSNNEIFYAYQKSRHSNWIKTGL